MEDLKVYKLRLAGPGPSLQVTVPTDWWKKLGLRAGARVEVEVFEDKLIVRPLRQPPKHEDTPNFFE